MVREGESPPWRLFAYGALAGMLPPGRLKSRAYVVVWVADSSDTPPQPDAETLRLPPFAAGGAGAQAHQRFQRDSRGFVAGRALKSSRGSAESIRVTSA